MSKRKRKPRPLTIKQGELLEALRRDVWKKAPPFTKSNTILSLKDRGLIAMRVPDNYGWHRIGLSYTEYELRKL